MTASRVTWIFRRTLRQYELCCQLDLHRKPTKSESNTTSNYYKTSWNEPILTEAWESFVRMNAKISEKSTGGKSCRLTIWNGRMKYKGCSCYFRSAHRSVHNYLSELLFFRAKKCRDENLNIFLRKPWNQRAESNCVPPQTDQNAES